MHFMRKVPPGAEASNILVGEVDFLDRPLSAFVRLRKAVFFADLTEVPVPTRFLFFLLGPTVSIFSIMSFYYVSIYHLSYIQDFSVIFETLTIQKYCIHLIP